MKQYTAEGIKLIRETLNMDKIQFAKGVGVTNITVSTWENGSRTPSESNTYGIDQLVISQAEKINKLRDGLGL